MLKQDFAKPNALSGSRYTLDKKLELTLLKDLPYDDNNHVIPDNKFNQAEPLIHFVDYLIEHALSLSVSDIHIEPYQNLCRIRYRQDSILLEVAEIPIHLAIRLIVRLKVMSKLDIAERRLPQDGRFQSTKHKIDIRINTCPTQFGEKIVLRLLDFSKLSLDIEQLGFNAQQKAAFIKKISQPQGMILVTGPTGSGKTVTLYSALNYLNSSEKNISTVEDPIEIQLKGINQVSINAKIGLDFATILRAFLRQDPDIMMVGEIRDLETATIAIQAAQTGHLVLSSIHANSAIETINRLQSMGVATYNLIGSLSLIIAQRLIRKLCIHCKLPDQQTLYYRAMGCEHCYQGYSGQLGIYEFLTISEQIAQLLQSRAANQLILEQAEREGFISLRRHAYEQVQQGLTSLNEMNRVIQDEK